MQAFTRVGLAGWLLATGISLPAAAVPLWTEGSNGDLSNSGAAPTAVSINAAGTYTLVGTVGAPDLDYLAVTLAAGLSLQSLQHTAYTSDDPVSFIAIQNSATFTESASAPNVGNLLGWTHFGGGTLATNILDDLCAGGGAIGCTPPLGPSTYSFWIQQASGAGTSYALDFNVIPEPGTLPLIGLGLAALSVSRRARRCAGGARR